jgi:hypothetical protein
VAIRWHEWNRRRLRDEAIVEAFLAGRTTVQLATEHGLTKMRVSQIIAAAGVSRREGGLCVTGRKVKSPVQGAPILRTSTP